MIPAHGEANEPLLHEEALDSFLPLQHYYPLISAPVNSPPQRPSLPVGPALVLPGIACSYSAFASDTDGGRLIYSFDWGDGSNSSLGPCDSGDAARVEHTWSRSGSYQVRARATDGSNASDWSEPLKVIVNSPPGQPSTPSGRPSARPGETCSFFTWGDDPDGDRLIYSFDWGDGSNSSLGPCDSGDAAKIEHIWSRSGSYQVRARATDGSNASDWSEPLEVIVNSPPDPPSTPSGRPSARPGETCSFFTWGEDPDGDRVRYTFDWGDGSLLTTNWTESGGEMSCSHAWDRSGTYQVRARACDFRGDYSGWSGPLTITVNTPPLRPDPPTGPRFGRALAPCVFQAYATDADGDFLNYTFDWGDGTSDAVGPLACGTNASANHAWSSPGIYQIRVDARDMMDGNRSLEISISIAANEQPDMPRDLYGPRSGYTGIVYTFFSMARDPDGDNVKFLLDWGDGTNFETGLVRSGSLENASHTWSRPGEYQVRASAIDSWGAPSEWTQPFLVVISPNDPPEQPARPLGPGEGICSISHEYVTSAIDPNGDPVKYVFDWGDGTTSWTGMDFLDSGEEKAASHKWRAPGVYQIKAAALDDKGSISEWSGTLFVKME